MRGTGQVGIQTGGTLSDASSGSTAADYDIIVEHDIMVRTRDGVRLATDIYRPARGGIAVQGRFPVILERTP